MLAGGDVIISTGGTGVEARSIEVKAELIWSTPSRLTLQAAHGIFVHRPMRVSGQGSLALGTGADGTGGLLSFPNAGRIVFANPSSQLTINGSTYLLTGSIHELAKDIAANPAGSYALMHDYDASADGIYNGSPIATDLTGRFNGLGNTISSFAMHNVGLGVEEVFGLFHGADYGSGIASLRLANIDVVVERDRLGVVGGLVGSSVGLLFDDEVSGTVQANHAAAGGIAGGAGGEIRDCHSSVAVTGSQAGGVVGVGGFISNSSASGPVYASRTKNSLAEAGGLVGLMGGSMHASYATGPVSGGQMSKVGGLVGVSSNSKIRNSYATGRGYGQCRIVCGRLLGRVRRALLVILLHRARSPRFRRRLHWRGRRSLLYSRPLGTSRRAAWTTACPTDRMPATCAA